MPTTDTSPGSLSRPRSDRVGQTIRAVVGGREQDIECVGDDGRRIAWKAKDGPGAGEWDARLWDINRRNQEAKEDG